MQLIYVQKHAQIRHEQWGFDDPPKVAGTDEENLSEGGE